MSDSHLRGDSACASWCSCGCNWKYGVCCPPHRVLQTVGLLNYKAFLLFLFYTMLAATLATALLLRSFIAFFMQGDEEDLARWTVLSPQTTSWQSPCQSA